MIKKDNLHLDVTMNGKQFIEYLKYKDSKRFKLKLTKNQKKAIPYFLVSLLGIILFTILIDSLTPSQPINFTWEGILMFLAICGGLGWVIHGTGFLLVRR